MFKIADETKQNAVDEMKIVLAAEGFDVSEEALGKAFEVAVDIVNKSFGL